MAIIQQIKTTQSKKNFVEINLNDFKREVKMFGNKELREAKSSLSGNVKLSLKDFDMTLKFTNGENSCIDHSVEALEKIKQ